MASQPPHQVAPIGTAKAGFTPQLIAPPSARDLRTQSVQRLQVGLFGLAAMLLLVGLANIIMDRARLADAANGIFPSSAAPSADDGKKSDPLADIGVVPAASPSETAPATPVQRPVGN